MRRREKLAWKCEGRQQSPQVRRGNFGGLDLHCRGIGEWGPADELTDRIVRYRVVGETDSLGVLGPIEVLRGGEIAHRAIPKAPPRFNFAVGLWAVSAGCRPDGTGDFRDASHQVTEEFGGIIRVDDVGGAASEEELIEKTRYEGGGLSVREGDKKDGFGEAVNEGEGFGFARGG